MVAVAGMEQHLPLAIGFAHQGVRDRLDRDDRAGDDAAGHGVEAKAFADLGPGCRQLPHARFVSLRRSYSKVIWRALNLCRQPTLGRTLNRMS